MSQPEAHQLSLGPLTGVAFGPDRTRESNLSPSRQTTPKPIFSTGAMMDGALSKHWPRYVLQLPGFRNES
jgi:hypothetical protein